MMKKREILIAAVWFVLVLIGQLVHFDVAAGDNSGRLSLSMILLPLIGYFFPGIRALGLAALAFLVLHIHHPFPITMGIPTMLATLSWQMSKENNLKNKLFHCGFPLLAMGYFMFQAPSSLAYPYALYWLIPVACTLFRGGLVARMLQSTFIAHATGSIIWVSLVPLAGSTWFSLIPIVAMERFIIVSISLVMIGALSLLHAKFAFKLRQESLAS